MSRTPKKEKVLLRENCAQISNRLFIKYVTVAVYVPIWLGIASGVSVICRSIRSGHESVGQCSLSIDWDYRLRQVSHVRRNYYDQ